MALKETQNERSYMPNNRVIPGFFGRIETAPGGAETPSGGLTHESTSPIGGLPIMVPKTCSVPECRNEPYRRGMCNSHRKRDAKWGDPNVIHTNKTDLDRFWPKVDKTEDCWWWTASQNPGGYGLFGSPKGYSTLAHRFAYQKLVGPIAEDLQLDHLCRNRLCVNPAHLEPVTAKENKLRGLGSRLMNGMDDSCVHGHLYTLENTYVNPNKPSDIRCVRCARNRQLARREAA